MTEKEAYDKWVDLANDCSLNLATQAAILEGFIRWRDLLPEFYLFAKMVTDKARDFDGEQPQ